MDECVEQACEDQPNGPAARSGHLEAGTLNLGEHTADEPYLVSTVLTTNFGLPESSSHNNLTQDDTVPRQQATRKRPAPDLSIQQGQLASETNTLSTRPSDTLDKWNGIAGREALAQLWLCLVAERRTASTREPESTLKTLDTSDTSIEGQLRRYQLQYQRGVKGISKKHKSLAEIPWRLYWANIARSYLGEKKARKATNKRRKRNRGRGPNIVNTSRKSVMDIFVDFLLEELLEKDTDTRTNCKTRFENRMQHGQRWAKLVDLSGSGILLLIPRDLSNE